jgi:low affinity Fe/Cu permease
LRPTKSRTAFSRFAKWTARATGRPGTFILAAAVIVVWAVTGPLFGFSDTWQLVINTGTTIITFLMVFLIQSTQNRDSEAMQVKLDEIIRAIGNAKNEVLDLEELEEQDLDEIRQTYTDMAQKAREGRSKTKAAKRGRKDGVRS